MANNTTFGNRSAATYNGTAMATVGSNGATPPPPPSGDAEYAAALERLQIEVGETEIHSKQGAGTFQPGDQQTTLKTNVYGLKSDDVPVYQYHLEMKKVVEQIREGLQETKEFPLIPIKIDGTVRKTSDYSTFTNRQHNRQLVEALIAQNPQVFGNDPDMLLYDFASTLYSLEPLQLSGTKLVLDKASVQQTIDRNFAVKCVIQAAGSFNSRDFQNNFSSDLQQHNSAVIRFLELATSRFASRHPEEHVMYESKKTSYMNPGNYNMKSPDLGGGKYLVPGASKTVHLVEGPKGNGAPAVVVDSKKTPFYHSINLLQMICESTKFDPKKITMNEAQYMGAEKCVKNLEVFPVYGNRQSIPITLKGLGVGNSTNNFVTRDGKQITLQEYFRVRYDISLQHPLLPVVAGARLIDGKPPLFPLELLWVADYQRVGNNNITSSDIATIVKSCAVPPSTKSNEIVNCHSSFGFPQERFLKAAKIQILDNPMQVPARILKAPGVQYANAPAVAPGPNGKWRFTRDLKYLHPAEVPQWSAVFLQYDGSHINFAQFKQFVRKYENEMRIRGIKFTPLDDSDILTIPANEQAVANVINQSDQGNYRFLLFGHPDSEVHLHSYIKGMERKFDVVTQCVRTKTIYNVLQSKMLSLENIVAKTNVKLGGINYNCLLQNAIIDPTILFIGLGMNHPGGGLGVPTNGGNNGGANPGEKYTGPYSVLGFSANDGKIPNEFIGNFFLQPVNRDEKVTILDSLVQEVMDRFIKNRGTTPSRVIFYRSGCSDGAFMQILRYEVPIVRAMVRDMAPKALVTFIIPSKLHSIRLFNKEINSNLRADEQNIRPGTVVDTGIVSKSFSEFYLNSHLALQGTAKTTKYTILFTDEEGASLDQFERWTNALAYEFQIVTSPTSLPAPVYVANRYAERGRQILNTFQSSEQANRKDELAMNGTLSNGTFAVTNGTSVTGSPKQLRPKLPGEQNAHYEKSIHFNFTKRNLRDKRVNA